nr:hypothetical protein [Candidatus Acidoferrales bacterium]
ICPACGAKVIRRSWHNVIENNLRDGKCGKCGVAVAGRWKFTGAGVSIQENGNDLGRHDWINL